MGRRPLRLWSPYESHAIGARIARADEVPSSSHPITLMRRSDGTVSAVRQSH
jgi:hypothetical protein